MRGNDAGIEDQFAKSDNDTIYVVHNGVGGEVDSVWSSAELALKRAQELNIAGSSFTLMYSIETVALDTTPVVKT